MWLLTCKRKMFEFLSRLFTNNMELLCGFLELYFLLVCADYEVYQYRLYILDIPKGRNLEGWFQQAGAPAHTTTERRWQCPTPFYQTKCEVIWTDSALFKTSKLRKANSLTKLYLAQLVLS